ncbi:conjugal transfer protein TraI [Amycolatopsis japonica]|uniref:conjugal transfer protein TraI n=1 Tax=Amycolatopsis japonica TaxID=208439 RepID=UPI0033CE8E9A
MTATRLDHDDDGDRAGEFSAGLAALEKHLADVAAQPADPALPPDPPAPDTVDDSGPAAPVVAGPVRRPLGRTRRVQRRIAEHAEAHELLTLEADDAPFEVTSDKVRTRRKAVVEAAALWRLGRDPRVLAFRDARMRRWITGLALVSLTLALAWSTAGVQTFAAEGAAKWSPQWWFAWLVEPFCSLALLMVVGGKAYLTTRGHRADDRSLDRAEWVFLGLTLGMNAWPHLPGIADEFAVSALVLHMLGPIVAMAVVRALPRLLAAFGQLTLDPAETAPAGNEGGGNPARAADDDGTPPTPTGPVSEPSPPAATRAAPARRTPAQSVRTSRTARIPAPKQRTPEQLKSEFAKALDDRPDGFDPTNAESIRRTLKCGKKQATDLKADYVARHGGDA